MDKFNCHHWNEYCSEVEAARSEYDFYGNFLAYVLATKRAANKYLIAMGWRAAPSATEPEFSGV